MWHLTCFVAQQSLNRRVYTEIFFWFSCDKSNLASSEALNIQWPPWWISKIRVCSCRTKHLPLFKAGSAWKRCQNKGCWKKRERERKDVPHRNTRQMLAAASPFVYLMMLFYFALTQYFSNWAHHQHSLPACSPLKKRENPLLSLYFSYKSTSDTHGNSQFSSRPPSLVSDPSGGCIHSAGPCLPSIMQSLMDSTEGRRQELLDHWKHHQPHLHLLLLAFFPPSVSTHELLFCHWAGTHSQVDKHTLHTWSLRPPPCVCVSLSVWSRCCLVLPHWLALCFHLSWNK